MRPSVRSMRAGALPSRKFAATSTRKSAARPIAEYRRCSYFFIASTSPVRPQDDAGREQGEADHRGEVEEVARVDHAALEAVEVRDDGEGGHGVDQRGARPARHEV